MNIVKETIDYIRKAFTFWIMVQPWEKGIRVRMGKRVKLLCPGMHWKLPFIDSVYVQSIRLRVIDMPLQTVTSLDGHPISIKAAVGYSISNIQVLFDSLHAPEKTISNITQSHISEFISGKNMEECRPSVIERSVSKRLIDLHYGVDFKYIKVIGYACVTTLRLMNDTHYSYQEETMNINDKK